jgi:hypothetical protein
MPRRRKTQSGADAQNIESVAGQRYGEGKAQADMQRMMPAPNSRESSMPSPQMQQPTAPDPRPTLVQQAASGPAQRNPAEILAQMPKNILREPSSRPITSGLPSGPGVGPEALERFQTMSPMRRTLEQMYKRTSNPVIKRMLDQGNL